MRKPTLKRFWLGLVQHLTVMCIMLAVAGILFNSYIAVDSMEGKKVYGISPLNSEAEFEDSAVFREIFKSAVQDITCLVVIKEQMETNGVFDSQKRIDITRFAERKGTNKPCNVTAVYELEDGEIVNGN